MNLEKIELNNAFVYNFYKCHPDISFEKVNCMLLKILCSIKSKNNASCIVTNNNNTFALYHEIYDELECIVNSNGNNIQGEIGEKCIEYILNKTVPSSVIIKNTDITDTLRCDYIMERKNKPNLLIQTKNIYKNVSIKECDDFISHVREVNSHGIFMSHHSGISGKDDMQIDVFNKSIIVYIHHANFSDDKIKCAINVIDSTSNIINEYGSNSDLHTRIIQKDDLDEINKEYNNFNQQKHIILDFIRTKPKVLINQIEDLKFSKLDSYLNKNASYISTVGIYTCTLCNFYTSNTLKGIAAHKRGCKKKHPN
jgi:hypothetical protein